ncbi:MAG: terminase family protein [Pseudomonadota bacterium]
MKAEIQSSPADRLAALPYEERQRFLDTLTDDEASDLLTNWREFLARPDQIAPDGNWDIWLILSGRGWGKTRTGSEWVRERVEGGARRIALIGETQRDLEKVMVEGDSGLLNCCPEGFIVRYNKRPVEIEFNTGAIALGFSGTEPDQLRGPQFDTAWSDELAKWRYARETWDQLQFGLRLGDPRQIVTTTPRPIQIIKDILAGLEGEVVVTRGRTLDNSANLAGKFLDKIIRRYDGTRLGRQELEGQVLGDMPGAIWQQDVIDLHRVSEAPDDLERIVVSIDPAVTNTENSDKHGIIVAGRRGQDAFVLEDGSMNGGPLDWARRGIAFFDKYEADAIVIEVNQGGDMVRQTLESVRPTLPIIEVRATRGKHVRAEPYAALYAQGRVHHVGRFDELETQMTMTTNAGYEGEDSPDQMDACVWALADLFPDMTRPINAHGDIAAKLLAMSSA